MKIFQFERVDIQPRNTGNSGGEECKQKQRNMEPVFRFITLPDERTLPVPPVIIFRTQKTVLFSINYRLMGLFTVIK